MVTKQLLYRCPLLLMLVTFMVASVAVSCSSNPQIDSQLTKADELMEQHPDSSLAILNGIDRSQLGTDKERARYALLMSMAIDKNYIDTTTFDVLQPAIDYYLDEDKGTPDEKLRTYYYQGRIYQNKGDRDKALNTFAKGTAISSDSKDSMVIARMLVAKGYLYYEFYDFESYTYNYLKAADIYNLKGCEDLEIECLLNGLNGSIVLNDKNTSDSIINIFNKFDALTDAQDIRLYGRVLVHVLRNGTTSEIKALIEDKEKILSSDVAGVLNLASAYNKLGNNDKALQYLNMVDDFGVKYDTLKYQAISVEVFRDLGNYKDALSMYWDFSHRSDAINSAKFEQKSKSIAEKHALELKAQEDARQKDRVIWGCVGLAMLLCIVILVYSLYVKRLKIEHTNDLIQIRNLRDNLFESGKRQEEMSNGIEKLFGTRFKLLDGLASSYFECKETGQEQKRIYAEVKNSIVDFSSETTTQELIDVVNGYKNGLVDNFKADYHKLSASQYRLALYLFCGFSLSSISIFMDTDLRNIYVYKSRLKSIISKGESPRKEEYLRYFA